MFETKSAAATTLRPVAMNSFGSMIAQAAMAVTASVTASAGRMRRARRL